MDTETLQSEVLGYNIHYIKVGNGPKVVFGLPGRMGSYRVVYKNLIELFAKRGNEFTFYSWDDPGYLMSQPPARKGKDISFEKDVEICAAFLKSLGHAKYHVMGWSTGAKVALRLAKTFPDMVEKVALWGAFDVMDAGVSKSGQSRDQNDQKGWIADLEAICVPVLVICGGKDSVITRKCSDFLIQHIKSARLEVIPLAQHKIQNRFSGELFGLTKSFYLGLDAMAPIPVGSGAVSLTDLPEEMLSKVSQYLGVKDLGVLRLVNRSLNRFSKSEIRKRGEMDLIFLDLKRLIKFNNTFRKYTPVQDIGTVFFGLPVLESKLAQEPLKAFAKKFGRLATTLDLDLDRSAHRDTVRSHVTLLLAAVRGHVKDLSLTDYLGICPSVIGRDAFPKLTKLTLRGGGRASADLDQAAILQLVSNVPALRYFKYGCCGNGYGGHPLFLANVLRTLATGNPTVTVEVKLSGELHFTADEDTALLDELSTVAVRIVKMTFIIQTGGNAATMGKMVNWISAHKESLRVLRLFDDTETPLRLPQMPLLEKLQYFQRSKEGLLPLNAVKAFPKLRNVTAGVSSKFFTVPFPTVTELTLSDLGGDRGQEDWRQFRLPPNLEQLTLPLNFVDLRVISQVNSLRRLSITTEELEEGADSFWERVAHGAEELTLDQILALPEPTQREIEERSASNFSDMSNLKQLSVQLDNDMVVATAQLNALVFISKMKRLERLETLTIMGYSNPAALVYIAEFQKYHAKIYHYYYTAINSETNQQ